jgi:hypothetical protein
MSHDTHDPAIRARLIEAVSEAVEAEGLDPADVVDRFLATVDARASARAVQLEARLREIVTGSVSAPRTKEPR